MNILTLVVVVWLVVGAAMCLMFGAAVVRVLSGPVWVRVRVFLGTQPSSS
jgi:hypothetical protein